MIFNLESAPIDRKFYFKLNENTSINVFTCGIGSYAGDIEFRFFEENPTPPHILIGRFCSIADKIYCSIGNNHPYKNVSSFPFDVKNIVEKIFGARTPLPYVRPNHYQIVIGHDVWLGRDVTIMGGVKIGNGAVIGAKAVVAKNIPPYAIAVGNPARVIKYRFDAETIKKFLAVKWWNWSLEKIADNFPLMNDVEKFLETHYSPALEEFPDDEFSRSLKESIAQGYRVYHFIPDFQANDPLWSKVIKDFCQSNLQNAALVIWLDKNTSEADAKALTAAIGDNQNILAFKHDENFSAASLRQGTHFITTREMSTLAALDYLWNTDVKIISALDNNIFGG